MGTREKPLHTNSIICLTLKGTGTISAWKAVTFVTVKAKQMVHIRKPLLQKPHSSYSFESCCLSFHLFQRTPETKLYGKPSFLFLIPLPLGERRQEGKWNGKVTVKCGTRGCPWKHYEEDLCLQADCTSQTMGASNSPMAPEVEVIRVAAWLAMESFF